MPASSQDLLSVMMADPTPRELKSPWLICHAARDGIRTAVFAAVARERTGLLHAMVNLVHAVDPLFQIDSGYVETKEDFFSGFLLIRTSLENCKQIDSLIVSVSEFAKQSPHGWQIPVMESTSLELRGIDRPGLLLEVCKLFSDYKIQIARFQAEQVVEFEQGADLLNAAEMPVVESFFKLCFDLELAAEALGKSDDLYRQLEELGLEIMP